MDPLSSIMKLLTLSITLTYSLTCNSTPAKHARENPYASITTTIAGLLLPTSTASAVVAGYEQAVQYCGPGRDAALQTLLQMYPQEVPLDNPQNVTLTDPSFLNWAKQQPTYETAEIQCEQSENALFVDELNATSAPSGSGSPTAGSVSATPLGSDGSSSEDNSGSTTASVSASAPTTSKLTGGAIGDRSHRGSMLFFTSFVVFIIGLGY
ncbi:hypothetical protein B0H11DRAFT_1988042 [Mycena galericulata]|nr:hypothetical protein B0H11DRAFT_1988042 [Mycena galericulata]